MECWLTLNSQWLNGQILLAEVLQPSDPAAKVLQHGTFSLQDERKFSRNSVTTSSPQSLVLFSQHYLFCLYNLPVNYNTLNSQFQSTRLVIFLSSLLLIHQIYGSLILVLKSLHCPIKNSSMSLPRSGRKVWRQMQQNPFCQWNGAKKTIYLPDHNNPFKHTYLSFVQRKVDLFREK